MASFDFPNNPNVGDTFNDPVTGATFRWNGYGWDGGAGGGTGAIIVAPSPPPTPPDSALWWESDTGYMYIRYNDGNSAQWVQVNAVPNLANYVAKTGDVMTGSLTLAVPGTAQARVMVQSAGSNALLTVNKAAGTFVNLIQGLAAGSSRWSLTLGDGTAESGTAAGSDFQIARYNNTGAYLDYPLSISRATGNASFGQSVTITKPYAATGDEALWITPSTGNAAIRLTAPASGNANYIFGYIGANPRWAFALGGGETETGSGNAGSNFSLSRYSDAGAYLDSPILVTRSNGTAQFINTVNTGSLTVASSGTGGINAYGGNMVIRASASGPNPILSLLASDNSGRAQFYCNISTGTVYMTNVAAASNLGLQLNGDVVVAPAAGHNLLMGTGIGYQTGGGPWTALSDARIKTVQDDYKLSLNEVLALRPVIYTYKGNEKTDENSTSMHEYAAEQQTSFVGLVAQEAEKIMPGMVSKQDGFIDGKPVTDLRSLNNGELIYALVNAVKELSAQNVALEARIATLEATP